MGAKYKRRDGGGGVAAQGGNDSKSGIRYQESKIEDVKETNEGWTEASKRERLCTGLACWLASLTFAGPGQWLSGRTVKGLLWFGGELALVGVWLLAAGTGKKWAMIGATAGLGLCHLAGWVSAARCGWRFHKVILDSSVYRILVMAGLVFVAPLPGLILVYGPGRERLVKEYEISESSMATALLGQHTNLKCQSCGYKVRIGLPVRPKDYVISEGLHCPMCGDNNFGAKKGRFLSGDRILTSQRLEPKRWDLVLFGSPSNPTKLLLKRVIGMGGEEVQIIDGDIFIDSQMVPKPALSHEEMWLAVSDTRYRASKTHRPRLRWQLGGSGESGLISGQGWWFSADENSQQWLELRGELTDAMIYNVNSVQYIRQEPVHDVRLKVEVSELHGEGELQLVWGHVGAEVTGILQTNGQARLEIRRVGERESAVIASEKPVTTKTTLMLIVRDGNAYLYANGKALCQGSVGPLEAKEARTGGRESCGLKIIATNCQGRISRIQLDRDIHYRAVQAQAVRVKAGHYYVLGDNSAVSSDSRLGWRVYPGLEGWYDPRLVPKEFVEGVVTWAYWPLDRIRSF